MGSSYPTRVLLFCLPLLFSSLACAGAGHQARVGALDSPALEISGPVEPAPRQQGRRERIVHNGWDAPRARIGYYFAGRRGRTELGGDFDGHTALLGPDLIDLPRTSGGDSWSLGFGYRLPLMAFELLYAREDHEGTLGGQSADVDLWEIQINILGYLPSQGALSPYGLLGIGFGEATLHNAGSVGALRGDAELDGGGALITAAGLQWQLSPHFALDFRAGYAWRSYDEAHGVTGSHGEVEGGVDACSWNATVGVLFGL